MRLLTTIILAMFAPSLLTLPALAAASTYARLMLQFPSYMPGQNAFAGGEFTSAPEDDEVKVPVTLGVMSRCPDALLCETVFDKVLPQVNDRINLTLSFIGQIDASEPDFGVTCLHGPLECAGNVHELCASNHLDQKQWWSYLKCLNFNGRGKIGEPETALKCAETAKFDWTESGVGDCAGQDGSGKAEEGISLLQESVRNSERLGIQKSCTVLINNKQVCIHDGTWKECEDGHAPEDFVRQINDEYDRLNAA